MSAKVVNFCTACGYPFQPDDKVCGNCGHRRYEDENIDATIYCPDCGREILPDNGVLYCSYCQHIIEPADDRVKKQEWNPNFLSKKAVPYRTTGSQQLATSAPIPEEVKRWSWPACILGFPWLFAHGMWGWAVVDFIFLVVSFLPHSRLSLAAISFSVYLGFKGNRLAWKRRHFRDVQHFLDVQHAWNMATMVVGVILVVLSLIAFIQAYITGGLNGVNELWDL